MNRLCVLALLPIFALAGCGRAPQTDSATSPGETPDQTAPGGNVEPGTEDHPAFTPPSGQLVTSSQVPLLEQINREYEKVAAAATPCIVRIVAMTTVDPHAQLFGDLPFRIPGLPHGVRQTVPSYGSGVIISHDGYIVTNDHVISDTQSVQVQLRDGRTFTGRVIASDDETDLAVLKISADGLPALPWGNSDKLQVGEQVFAIGNPFDLADSVSRGIVSATNRSMPDSNSFEDYIQTDAAINVGNSGGALVNIHGELIGINTAIASYTRGNEGVGFSIPSNTVRPVVETLLRGVRGYLGVQLPVKVDDGVVEQLGIGTGRGALLAGVLRKSPADDAKLRSVDFITGVDGHPVDGVSQLRLLVAQIPIGKEVQVSFIRGGNSHTTRVKIAELPKDPIDGGLGPLPDPGPDPAQAAPTLNDVLTGLQVADLNDKNRQQFGVENIVTSGVVVTGVQEGSPADIKGLQRGDVIEMACAQRGSIQALNTAADFAGLTKGLKPDQSVVLLIHHGKLSGQEDKSSMFLYLEPMK
jgi:serine protease Do